MLIEKTNEKQKNKNMFIDSQRNKSRNNQDKSSYSLYDKQNNNKKPTAILIKKKVNTINNNPLYSRSRELSI